MQRRRLPATTCTADGGPARPRSAQGHTAGCEGGDEGSPGKACLRASGWSRSLEDKQVSQVGGRARTKVGGGCVTGSRTKRSQTRAGQGTSWRAKPFRLNTGVGKSRFTVVRLEGNTMHNSKRIHSTFCDLATVSPLCPALHTGKQSQGYKTEKGEHHSPPHSVARQGGSAQGNNATSRRHRATRAPAQGQAPSRC